jgi:hypothetical protein
MRSASCRKRISSVLGCPAIATVPGLAIATSPANRALRFAEPEQVSFSLSFPVDQVRALALPEANLGLL